MQGPSPYTEFDCLRSRRCEDPIRPWRNVSAMFAESFKATLEAIICLLATGTFLSLLQKTGTGLGACREALALEHPVPGLSSLLHPGWLATPISGAIAAVRELWLWP